MKKWLINQKNKLNTNKNKSQEAFTLIEILVAITIIAIMIAGTNLLSYKNISTKQELDIKVNKIISQIEKLRNDALLWKWIWTNLIVPKKYKIDFSTSWSWKINYYYFDWTYKKYDFFDKKVNFWNNFEKIKSIKCLKINWDNLNPLTNSETWTIIIEWNTLSLSGKCKPKSRILELEIQKRQISKKIWINTVNWLVQTKK